MIKPILKNNVRKVVQPVMIVRPSGYSEPFAMPDCNPVVCVANK